LYFASKVSPVQFPGYCVRIVGIQMDSRMKYTVSYVFSVKYGKAAAFSLMILKAICTVSPQICVRHEFGALQTKHWWTRSPCRNAGALHRKGCERS
jgi:hypothetical protein